MDSFSESLGIFKQLLKFDTTNPPGNEREAIHFISDLLKKEGLSPTVLESADKRANLIVRLKGDGSAKPLHISSHVDVVTSESKHWKYPPFSATEAEGCIWGRGAIDMKNMTAYCIATVQKILREKIKLKRDLIMSVVADEEVGGKFGMGWLTANHPELVRAEYYISEVGGYSVHRQGKTIYPIQVGEKGSFWINVKFHGSPGHGSIPNFENVHFKLSKFLNKLGSRPLPSHRTKTTDAFMAKLSDVFGPMGGLQFKIMSTNLGYLALRQMAKQLRQPEKLLAIGAMLSNTAAPTGIKSGAQHNVIPSELILKLDCRILPGQTSQNLIQEIEDLTGEELDFEVVNESQPYESDFDTPLFRDICRHVERADRGSTPVPTLTVGSTDAQYMQKLGAICYGFTPIKLPEDLNFPKLFHGHNERIPVEGFRWGLEMFSNLISDFSSKTV